MKIANKEINLFYVFLLFFPTFSITEILELPRLNNVALLIFLFFSLHFLKHSSIKFNSVSAGCWIISSGLLMSCIGQVFYAGIYSYLGLVFSLYWFSVPVFLNYWVNIEQGIKERIITLLVFLNFSYAIIQLIFLKTSGYSLLWHRLNTEYTISDVVQDSPFKYIGLNEIHSFLRYIGGAVTGLFGERVGLACLCIIILFTFKVFGKDQDKINIKYPYNHVAKIIALVFLTIIGSSLSFWLVLFPAIYIIFYCKRYLSFFKAKLKEVRLSIGVQILLIFVLISLSVGVLYKGLPVFTELIALVDHSKRLSGLFSIGSYLSDSHTLDYNFFFGWGLVTTRMLASDTGRLLPEGITAGLSVFGYLFTSYGFIGLAFFLIGYIYLLWKYTVLSLGSAILLSGILFMAVGSPLDYTYIYALIILSPQRNYKHHFDNFNLKEKGT